MGAVLTRPWFVVLVDFIWQMLLIFGILCFCGLHILLSDTWYLMYQAPVQKE